MRHENSHAKKIGQTVGPAKRGQQEATQTGDMQVKGINKIANMRCTQRWDGSTPGIQSGVANSAVSGKHPYLGDGSGDGSSPKVAGQNPWTRRQLLSARIAIPSEL